MSQAYVVVGGGLAAGKAVETLRDEGFAGPVVLVSAEEELPYERPPLSKGYLLGKEPREGAYVNDRDWYDERSVGTERTNGFARAGPGSVGAARWSVCSTGSGS